MPLQQTAGNVTQDAYGGGVAVEPVYIEQIFSTYLYPGNASTVTVNNGIDLATYGGMVWLKSRNNASSTFYGISAYSNHFLTYAANERSQSSNTTAANSGFTNITAYNSNGFNDGSGWWTTDNLTSWTFRKQPKFFDVVTYTGNGVAGRQIAHSLGSVPGCIIVKRTDAVENWGVYHAGIGPNYALRLNLTDGQIDSLFLFNRTAPTATNFTLGSGGVTNASGGTYVAYLFAHDAGGFGLTGTDNVISCGSFTLSGGAANVTLGWEPQYLLLKRTDAAEAWFTVDTMRGWTTAPGTFQYLMPNASNAEAAGSNWSPNATGFALTSAGSGSYIYIAIRRGPMKTPTDATKVFNPATTSASTGTPITTGFPVDMQMMAVRGGTTSNTAVMSRLTGVDTDGAGNSYPFLYTSATAAETGSTNRSKMWGNTGVQVPAYYASTSTAYESFARAPGFFDEVCYTGTGAQLSLTHNLGVTPELMIVKRRDDVSGSNGWPVWTGTVNQIMWLNLNLYRQTFNNTFPVAPTSTVFTVGTNGDVNLSGATYVAYLFATCPGVSKVGSYTGTGTTQQINCGFTAGARFVLIKRTDSTGNWGVLDTARGMVSGTDPYLNLNTTAAEVNANNVYTATGGFQLVSSDANFNASGGSYIFLAVA